MPSQQAIPRENITAEVIQPLAAGRSADERQAVAPFAEAEKVIAATRAIVWVGGSRALYNLDGDFIQCPERDRFVSAERYYGTIFHGLCYWHRHASRLNRLKKFQRFGSETYAMEELVAELGCSLSVTSG